MTREEVLMRLRPLEADLRARGIEALYLFGSVARGDARPDSDVDLACEIDEKKRVSLLDFCGFNLRLEEVLGTDVDLCERQALRPRVRARVEKDLVRVF